MQNARRRDSRSCELASIVIVAVWMPARRAAMIDPIPVLRDEWCRMQLFSNVTLYSRPVGECPGPPILLVSIPNDQPSSRTLRPFSDPLFRTPCDGTVLSSTGSKSENEDDPHASMGRIRRLQDQQLY
jgi:hypothetical protein